VQFTSQFRARNSRATLLPVNPLPNISACRKPHDILPIVGRIYFIPALLLLTARIPAGPVAPEILHLAAIQSKAKIALSGIPAYTCSEVMERSTRGSSRYSYHMNDQLKFEVAEIGGKELFSRPGEKTFSELAVKQFSSRGLVATGMFFHIADTVFGTPYARFQYAGPKRVKGHKSLQYDLTVSPLFASYRLNFNNHEAQVGFRGSFWADESSLDLIRLHIEATEVPPEMLLRSAITEIDYTRTALDGKSYLIPSSAEIVTIFMNGSESRNQIKFSNCHKYGVESTVTFQ
jgi:hypothetical protein